jgi:uncharacterized Zn finger protein
MKLSWYLVCKSCGYKKSIPESMLPSGNFSKLNARCSKCGEYTVECELLPSNV